MRKQLFVLVVVALCFSQMLYAQVPAGSLSLIPAAGTFPVGSKFDVQVIINSGGEGVKTCQTYINFDATAVSITASAITVNEDVFDFKLIKKVDAGKSQIQIVYGCQENEPPVGNAILFATLKFTALKEGVTAVTFDQANSQAQMTGAINLIGAWNDGSYTLGGGPKRWDFTTDAEGWLNTGQVLPFDAPVYAHSAVAPGTLNITCNSTNTYGFWYKDAAVDNIAADTLYRARFAVNSDQTDKKAVPTFRLRYNASNFMQGDAVTVNSLGEGEASPDGPGFGPKLYDLFFRPQHEAIAAGVTGTLSFDLINVASSDAAVATLFLDYVQLDKMPISNAGTATQVQLYTFDAGEENWTSSGQIATLDAPLFDWIEDGVGALTMETINNTNCYGFWQNNQTQIAMDKTVLYQIRVNLGNELPAKAPSALPTVRIRYYDHEANQMVGTFQAPVLKTYEQPVTSDKAYTFDNYYGYFQNQYGMGANLGVAVEVINLDPAAPAVAKYAVNEVEISSFAVPTF